MLPGKALTPAILFQIARRRVWLIAVPPVVTLFAALLYSANIIDLYQSEMLIAVDPQRVPESYVRSTITLGADRRLEALKVKVLSRSALLDLIERFNLYPRERAVVPIEDVIGRVRTAIGMVMQIPRPRWGEEPQPTAFRVQFTYTDPAVAQKVTSELGQLFVDQNVRDRGAQAGATSRFLDGQLAAARAELEAQERRLEQFRQRHGNALPSQMVSNQQAQASAQMRAQSIVESVARDRDRKMMLERLYREAVHDASVSPPSVVSQRQPAGGEPPPSSARQQLATAKATLATLEQRYTPDHPDVARARRMVRELEPKAAEEATALVATAAAPATSAASVSAGTTPEGGLSAERRESLRQMRAEIESLDRQIGFKETEEGRVRSEITEYQRRIEAVPGIESEWAALTRDYDTKQTAYKDLLGKSAAAQLATNLEEEDIGERFRIVDAASYPVRPVASKRLMYNAGGCAAGLALGLALALLLELRDKSFRTATDVVDVLALPVLATVPRVQTSVERSRERRLRVVVSMAGLAGVCIATYMTWALKLWNSVW